MSLAPGSRVQAHVGKWLGLSPKGLKPVIQKVCFFMEFPEFSDGFGGFSRV